jgi:DNA methyltransferase 1-associated protein 1
MQDSDSTEPYIETCTDYLKYDIKVDMPDFTDEEYDAHLRSDDWSREETDYLFGIVKDYAYRWAVIWDRYEWQALKAREREAHAAQAAQEGANEDATQSMATLPFAPPKDKERSLEEMKARFYDISAKLMKLRIPEVQMDAEQYSLYETLAKFDPALEKNRKMLATALMNRSMDEVKEEEFLLTELQRINMAANRLDAEREELRARLDAPQPNTSVTAGVQAFTSSTALQALFQQLFQQDRSKKRASGGTAGPGRLSLSANDMITTPGQQQLSAAARRQSMAQPPVAQTPVKQLTPRQEHRFNVSTHDRLTSGVTFGSDKLLKMRQAKSNVQTQKIAAALAELGVADIISIPTSNVADVFEALVQKVGKLLDLRKVREKEQGECRVLLAMKNQAGGKAGNNNNNSNNAGGQAGGSGAANPSAPGSTVDTTFSASTSVSASATPRPKAEADTAQNTPGNEDDDDEDEDEDEEDEDDNNADDQDNANDDDEDEDDDADDDDNATNGAVGDGSANGDGDGDGGDGDGDAENDDVDAEGEDETAQTSRATSQGAAGATAAPGAGRKRSASVFSQGSAGGSGREKRARK